MEFAGYILANNLGFRAMRNSTNDFKIAPYTWSQVRESVHKSDKEFADVVDEWDPGDEYKFFELTYPFGAQILDIYSSGFQLPLVEGGTIPLSAPEIPPCIKHELGYNFLPLGIPIQGGIEVYHRIGDSLFSLAFFSAGLNLGIWEAFGPPAPYSVSSGARSLIMAPKITDTESHKKLRDQFNLRLSVPRTLFDQWNIFVELAKQAPKIWESKVLFLNSKWLEPKKKNLSWLKFYKFLQKKAWQHTAYARYKSVFEVNWKHFYQALRHEGERFDPYLIETLRHLIFVGQGVLPAFGAAGQDETHGPINFLMTAYTRNYGLKNYVPTILAPYYFKRTHKSSPVYYSFQNPTLLDFIPKMKSFSSAVDDMRNFKNLLEHFVAEVVERKFNFGDNSLYEIIKDTQFDFFHSEMHTYADIQPSEILPETDSNLIYMPDGTGRQFASKGSFFRCCIRISSKSN